MTTNSISAKVLDAAGVVLSGPIVVHGMNTYTISSDFISWNEVHNHSISDIAADFGHRAAGAGDKIFVCGDDTISVYDFGLLFTVFTAMTTAHAELGNGFPITETDTSKKDVHALWLGNDLIVYSAVNNLIIPVDNADVERACSGKRLECGNFCTQDRFLIDRERVEFFVVDAQRKDLFCRFHIADGTQAVYNKYFAQPEESSPDIMATWDTESGLGRLVAGIGKKLPTKDVFQRYKKNGLAENIDGRSDLFVKPEQQYDEVRTPTDLQKFFGSICYTDKEETVIAVNFHAGLLVYSPCFPGDSFEGLQVDPNPDFSKFYDVSAGCERIMRFANTVVARPLTSAQLDIKVFNSIALSLLNMGLPRLSFASCLGKVVIPESVLMSTFETGFGSDLFCMVPVGVVGEVVVCKTAEGKLEAVYPRGWTLDEAFYDITEVVRHVEH